ncbi:hypothetical protein [Streptomyces sp. NPDC058092]|uniref:hypothetical protein n=1 Tax=Streptomyces sp. NPDC058092 TaxID=3346336 RepID=UPI0036EE5EBD
MSSCSGYWWCGGVAPSVTDQSPQDVDPAAGEGEHGLDVLVALRDAVRRREVWVVGANRWRNPEDDLPADFEDNRDVHYAGLGQPQDAGEFIAALHGKLRTSLDRFEQALAEGTTGGVAIVKKHGEPWIRVSPRGKQEEPESLVAIKARSNDAGAPSTCWTS